ncbi:MAG TPA: ribose-phosphate pyrophosphokinase [Myxococcota bacterium]|nr:ribose-phosphate pyrophosphokinase [Myxococcota bacterium]
MYMEIRLLRGNAHPALSEAICAHLGVPLGRARVGRFSDGEIQVEIDDNVRGRDVYIIQPTCAPTNDNLMELLILVDACKRASAGQITAVIPYYGYSRQDRKVAPRAPITAKLVADLLHTAGVDRVLTMDLHAGQIQGFFDMPVDNLYAAPTLCSHLARKVDGSHTVVVSPDAGGVERARFYAKRLGAGLAIIDKRRSGPNQAEALHIIGDVREKDVVIIDDMIDTAGTLAKAATALKGGGARRILAAATHAVLSGPAVQKITESALEQVIVTDTLPLAPPAAACGKIEVVSVSGVFAEAIRSIHSNDSVSRLFR